MDASRVGSASRHRLVWWVLYAFCWAALAFAVLYYPITQPKNPALFFGIVSLLWLPLLAGLALGIYSLSSMRYLGRAQAAAIALPILLARSDRRTHRWGLRRQAGKSARSP